MYTVSCIVCAHNEGPRIGAVLSALIGHSLIQEIIVIDDGSTDDTTSVAKTFPGISLVAFEQNTGKSKAMAEGIRRARGRFLLFVDADLIGLAPYDLTKLLQPVLDGIVDTSISMKGNAWPIFKFSGLDYLSGERVLPRALLQDSLSALSSLPPYGIETYINERIIRERLRVAIIQWNNVTNPPKM